MEKDMLTDMENSLSMKETYFPILIESCSSPKKLVCIHAPKNLPKGILFKVIETNYKEV
jgi:hypothetical protein